MPGTTDPRPVVVAVDPSSSARDAAAWAADVAADWAAPLHVVHVAPGDPRDLPLDRLPVWLVELVAMAERAGARPCTVEAQPGDVVDTIAARGVGARMVVLGSYGEGAFDGMLVGSAALGVVERVDCPLAVVRGSAPRIAPPRGGPVVVGVDASRAGEAAAVFAADVAASLGARLLVVRCRSDFSTAARRRAAPQPPVPRSPGGRSVRAGATAGADRGTPSVAAHRLRDRRRAPRRGTDPVRRRRPRRCRRSARMRWSGRDGDRLHEPGGARIRDVPRDRRAPATQRGDDGGYRQSPLIRSRISGLGGSSASARRRQRTPRGAATRGSPSRASYRPDHRVRVNRPPPVARRRCCAPAHVPAGHA